MNHARSFLCRGCDRLFRAVVGLYHSVRTPLGGFDGIRDCGNRRGVSVCLFDVRLASTRKILRW